jgi:hypothetical protein
MTSSVPAATAFEYAGNGSTKAFSFPLRFLENADVRVSLIVTDEDTGEEIETVQTLTTHYSLTGAGTANGGTVNFLTAPASGVTVKIARRTKAKQTVDLTDTGRTPGDTLELQLDRLAMIAQELDERFDTVETTPGPAGTPGVSNFFFEAGTPSDDDGADGDIYWDTDTDDVYKKIGGSWVLKGNARGEQGEQGPQGPQGPGGAGTGDMLAANNLSDVANAATAFGNIKQAATESATGVVELATSAEVKTGTDTARAITPAGAAAVYERKGKLSGQDVSTDSFTLALTDAGKLKRCNKATAMTVTVPPQSSVSWEDDMFIDIAQTGAGQVTIAAGSGVTIRSSGGKLKLAGQYSAATLFRNDVDTWLLVGDLVA